MKSRLPRLPHPGSVVALAIMTLVAGGFLALLLGGGEKPGLFSIGPYLARTLLFSASQAALSTLLSVVLGGALALALARRHFFGRNLVLAALSTTMVMPTIVAVFAVFAVYGRSGWISEGLAWIGWEGGFSIFGYPGILIAHVFLNAPFVARMMLEGLSLVPAEHWRLASALGFSPAQIFRHLDWPVLRNELPGIAGLVFLLCFKSFAIVLALGGGPNRSTLEVAIYEALKIDLDFGRAAWLALIQLAICLALTLLLNFAFTRAPVGQTVRGSLQRSDIHHRGLKGFDIAILTLSAFFILPLLLSILDGLRSIARVLDADLLQAFFTSMTIALAAGLLTCLFALALAAAARRQRLVLKKPGLAALYDLVPSAMLAIPPFALTAGLYLIMRPFAEPALAGFFLLPVLNALAALPFAYRHLAPPLSAAEERYGRLAASLGLSGLSKFRIMDWPVLRRPLSAGFALSVALSFGDFGIIALFGGTDLRTLPYLLYERLGAYRLEEASAIGLVIVLVALLLAHASSRLSHAGP